MRKNNHLRGILCTLIGASAWGFSGACGQILTQNLQIDTMHITFLRAFFAGVILTVFSSVKNPHNILSLFKDKKDSLSLAGFSIFGLLLSQVTYLKAISYSNAGTATVLQYVGPIFVMLFTCITKKRLPGIKEIISCILAFSGVVILATHGDFSSLALSKECLFWGLGAAMALLFYTVIPGEIIPKYGAVTVTGLGFLISGLCLIPFVKPWSFPPLPAGAIAPIVGMIVIGSVMSYTMYMQGVKDIGAVKASMIACIEPVSAVLFACLWLKSKFMIIDITGFILILSTVFILGKKEN